VAGAAIALIEARTRCLENYPGVVPCFEDLLEEVDRRRCNSKAWQALILAGALDDVPADLDETGVEIDEPIERRNALLVRLVQKTSRAKNPEMPVAEAPTQLRDRERELLGVALSWWASKERDELRDYAHLTTIQEAANEEHVRVKILAEVTRVKTHAGRRGTMAFLTVADETGSLENLTIWAEQWKAYRERLAKGRIAAFFLRRKENDDDRYGQFSYMLDEDRTRGPTVIGLQALQKQRAENAGDVSLEVATDLL
jgi:DNA polymerase III alpha subunit